MTKTDLFRILIKTMGLFCAIEGLFTLIPVFRYTQGFFIMGMVLNTVFVLLVLGITYVLLFQTDRIIRWLRLEKGFDGQHIDLGGLDKRKGLYIALLIIGGLLLVNNLPTFLYECYDAIKHSVVPTYFENDRVFLDEVAFEYRPMAISGLASLFGFLILTNYQRLAQWVERKP
jgi:hypothetical protein